MSDHEFKAPERAGEPDEPAARMAEIRARAEAATDGPWRMRHGATTEDAIHVEFGEVLVVPDGWGWADNDWRKINADAEFIAHARSDVPWLMAEVDRLTGERDRARGLAARLEEQVARVEALAVVVANRMMATAKPSEIWAALRGEGACEGSPMCPGETHTEGCYSLAWTAADWQQCTDARCLTPCTGCARDALTEAQVARVEELADPAIDVIHLDHQRQWSRDTFGPGPRTAGVLDHIRKELAEIEADPTDLTEWVDLIILAFDGAWRHGAEPSEIIAAIKAKQARNESRSWPDWRTAEPGKAIEHIAEAGGE